MTCRLQSRQPLPLINYLDPEEEKLQLLGIVSSIDTGDPDDGDKLFPIVDENRFPIEGKFYLYPQGIVKAFAVDDIADHIFASSRTT